MLVITADQNNLDTAKVDPRFGRCNFLVFFNPENGSYEIQENDAGQGRGGAGIMTAQMIVDRGGSAVLTGNIGPNAARVLAAAGIAVFRAEGYQIREAVALYQEGKLPQIEGDNVGPHFGLQNHTEDKGVKG